MDGVELLTWLRRHFSRGKSGNAMEVAWQEEDWRDLRPEERELIERMLSEPFAGRDELLAQLSGAKAKTIDEDRCLSFQITSTVRADLPIRVPVTARSADEDGMFLEINIHVVDGRLHELELWRGDLAPVQRLPRASDLEDFWIDPELLPGD